MTRKPVKFSRAYWLILSKVFCCFSDRGRVLTATYQTTTAKKGREIATIQAKDGLVKKIIKTLESIIMGVITPIFKLCSANCMRTKASLVIRVTSEDTPICSYS